MLEDVCGLLQAVCPRRVSTGANHAAQVRRSPVAATFKCPYAMTLINSVCNIRNAMPDAPLAFTSAFSKRKGVRIRSLPSGIELCHLLRIGLIIDCKLAAHVRNIVRTHFGLEPSAQALVI
jgi:hypothetical protein